MGAASNTILQDLPYPASKSHCTALSSHNMEPISTMRRRAISSRHSSLAQGSMTVFSFNFPLPPSQKAPAKAKFSQRKPDFSGFSWKQPSLLAGSALDAAAPISPRTVATNNHSAE